MSEQRPYDVVVWGATGFTGGLVADVLAASRGGETSLKWAIAGRDRKRLEDLRHRLGADVGVIVADSHDVESLEATCRQTRVVLSTVGPYALHGSELIAASIATGTDYCDLSGEVPWMRQMLDRHAEAAAASGARLVHCCGFDSIPSDVGCWWLQREAVARFGRPLRRVRARVRRIRGSASGGTVASMLNIIEQAREDKDVARWMANPYALNPDGLRRGVRQSYVSSPRHEPDFDAWAAPFIMAAINSRVVHRSHALLGQPWGADFRYDEAMLTGAGLGGRMRATTITAGLAAFAVGARFGPSRSLMQRLFLPEPGEGPDAEAREAGGFEMLLRGDDDDGRTLTVRVTGDRDPGYGATSRMISEAAVSLARDEPVAGFEQGFLTPATALGPMLLERLPARAGVRFEVIDDG